MILKFMWVLALMDNSRLNGVKPARGWGRAGIWTTAAIASQRNRVITLGWCRFNDRPMRGAEHAIHDLNELGAIVATSNGSWDRVRHHTQTVKPLNAFVGV